MHPEPPRPAKYRASCDNCARSKVKCSGEKPKCKRCVEKGASCDYSPAQRSRRPRSQTSQMTSASATGSRPPTSGDTAATASARASITAISFEEFADDHLGSSDITMRGADAAPDLTQDFDAAFFEAGRDLIGAALGSDASDISAWLSQSNDPGGATTKEGNDLFSPFPARSVLLGIENTTMGGTGDTASDLGTVCTQNCSEAPLGALKVLKSPVNAQWAGLSKIGPHDLGEILQTSRSALQTASKVVSCTCSANSDVALLTTSVLLRITGLYEAVLRSSSTSGADAGAARDPASPDGHLVKADCGMDPPSYGMPSMSIGNYEIALEDRPAFLMNVLQSEVKKMGAVLDLFSKKFCSNGLSLADNNDERFNLILERFIRMRHNTTLTEIRKRLGVV